MSHVYVPVALRRAVYERAGGRCEYCLIPEAFTLFVHEVDHIVAHKHGGATVGENLALSCILCNQHKGSDIASIDPDTGRLEPLFHPRMQCWGDHFVLEESRIEGRTAIGRVTVKLLRFNDATRVVERAMFVEAGAFDEG